LGGIVLDRDEAARALDQASAWRGTISEGDEARLNRRATAADGFYRER
jgi:hypothetical protein